MKNYMKKTSLTVSAALVAGMMAPGSAQAGGNTTGNNISAIAENIITSMQSLPAMLSGVAYMFGILLGTLGILKIKDHVENPSQTALKDGAVRLAAGGALFSLPIVYEAMMNTIGADGSAVGAAPLNKIEFSTR